MFATSFLVTSFWGMNASTQCSRVSQRSSLQGLRMAKHPIPKATKKHVKRRPRKSRPSDINHKPTHYALYDVEWPQEYTIVPGEGSIPPEFLAKIGSRSKRRQKASAEDDAEVNDEEGTQLTSASELLRAEGN
ncbi:hypothetical protein CCYA_CCYA09G2548 [Cyanidiococcus yangmingshanensis]|nr:hypothetical protein CCYA_CCYA09G2548 [Cyanidiococcus yangmingshanensis]